MRNNEILDRFNELEAKILSSIETTFEQDAAAKFLGVSTSTLYKLTSANKVPFCKPNGHKMVFLKSDLHKFLLSNRVPSISELEHQ